MKRCSLCPSPATDTIDVSSGHHIPVCDACLAGLAHTPAAPLPWELSFDPKTDSLLDALVDALVVELRGVRVA